MRLRGFEKISGFEHVHLPKRATKDAAGYDFESAVDICIPADSKPVLVPTGIKAYMPSMEYLQLFNRSSNAYKRQLFLANGVGVVDADYYDNVDNEGHIQFLFVNASSEDIWIAKGERIGQGIFLSYLKADQDEDGLARVGGFGSSGLSGDVHDV